MAKTKENVEREHRIMEEIIVDAYGPQEQAGEVRTRDIRRDGPGSTKACRRIPRIVGWLAWIDSRAVRRSHPKE
jgi:hypothetical protein